MLNIVHDIQDQMKDVSTGTEENDNIEDFALTKNDPKYQTLPYNTKFTINLLNRISKPDQYDNYGNIDIDINKKGCNDHISNHINRNFNLHMTVHSAPLNVLNKNVALPLNQPDVLVKKNGENQDQCYCNASETSNQNVLRENIHHSSMNVSSSNTNTFYQVSIIYLCNL